ncbi:MAG: ABC transporter permease, partial [Solirubrobacteraceae bacterium]
MTGAGALLVLALRRDRRALPAWVLGLGALVVLAGAGLESSYPTQPDRDAFAASVAGNGALIALRGPQRALETAGGALAWQLGWFAAVIAGLMGALLVVRHTRGDEETGRTELVLAAPVARAAPAVAALAVAGIAAVLVAVVITLGLLATGLPAAGSVAFGASIGGVALVFAGVALVTAQVSESARAASGMAGAAIGAAYVLRAIGDVGDGTVSWLSPIGWAQAMRPFAGERWWPLLLFAVATAALVAVAV